MIITELSGGLGNQMFQYAAGKCLAHQYNVPLLLDTKYLLDRSSPSPDFVFRNFDLAMWNIMPRFATDEEVETITGQERSPKTLFQKIIRKTSKTFFPKDYSQQIYRETQFHFNKQFYQQKTPLYLQGYWQSEKYFKPIADSIKQEFTFKEPIKWADTSIANAIINTQSICLNVRRGDYVTIKKTSDSLGFVGLDYLLNGVKYITQQVEKPHFFVFSDEIQWCKEHIKINFPITFVSNDNPDQTFKEDLALMQLCKHFIISNSTFAWWAAWLANNPTKIVVSPKRWFADQKINSEDVIPENWVRI
jgi:hypothetical protein